MIQGDRRKSGELSNAQKVRNFEITLISVSAVLNLLAVLGVAFLYSQVSAKTDQLQLEESFPVLTVVAGILGMNVILYFISLFLKIKKQPGINIIHPAGFKVVYSESAFFDILKQEMRRAGRYHLPMTLCLIKPDGANASVAKNHMGFGPEQFQSFSDLVINIIRSSDFFCRTKDNRFYVLLCHTDLGHAEHFALRLLLQSQERLEMSFTSGLTGYRIGERLDDFLKRSEKALTRAKHEGRAKTQCTIGRNDSPVVKNF